MNLTKIVSMQKELDVHIRKEHNLMSAYLVKEKTLALLVEIGELANETRCFKFWSTKPASEKKVILEEYVDGLHFIVSLCIDREVPLENMNFLYIGYIPNRDITEDFLDLYDLIISFRNSTSSGHKKELQKLLDAYVSFGLKLGFAWEQIEQAYISKNEVNHERQENGY